MELHPIRNAATLRFQPGDQVGKLTVIRAVGAKHFAKGVAVVFHCRCECGAEVERDRQTLIRSRNTSCGCHRRGRGTMPKGRHCHPLRKSWAHMIDRCTNPKNKSFKDYGARGICVCERWVTGEGALTGLEHFAADMGNRPDGLTLERKDPNAGYSPENCVWANRTTQSRNRRSLRMVEYRGETLPASQWAERVGIPYFTLVARLKHGWPIERALTEPVRPHK